MKKNEVYFLNYILNIDDYKSFNRIIMNDMYRKKQSIYFVCGVLATTIGALFMAFFALSFDVYLPLMALALLLLLLGLLMISIFPVFYRKDFFENCEKEYFDRDKGYASRMYKYSVGFEHIKERMSYSDGFLAGDDLYHWESIKRIYIANEGVVLLFAAGKGIYLPSRISRKDVDIELKASVIKKGAEHGIICVYEN